MPSYNLPASETVPNSLLPSFLYDSIVNSASLIDFSVGALTERKLVLYSCNFCTFGIHNIFNIIAAIINFNISLNIIV